MEVSSSLLPTPSTQSTALPAMLTSTTAPGKVFSTRAELAEHYKTQWHKYNLKRREAGLPPLLETDFEARLAAAQEAMAAATADKKKKKGSRSDSHLKNKNLNGGKDKTNKEKEGGVAVVMSSQVPSYDRMKEQQEQEQPQNEATTCRVSSLVSEDEKEEGHNSEEPQQPQQEQMSSTDNDVVDDKKKNESQRHAIEINPHQCLFDRHISATVEENVARMQRKYGFFVPDQEYLTDLEGLVGYCHEKIQLGRLCLYCQHGFSSGRAVQQHMLNKRHAKLRYEPGIDLEEFAVFYDFAAANQEFLASCRPNRGAKTNNNNKSTATSAIQPEDAAISATDKEKEAEVNNACDDDDDEDGEEWEDVSEDEPEEEQNDDNEEEEQAIYAGYEREVAALGLDVTPLGEIIFPDGRIIGHRAFRRYYKQRTPASRSRDDRASVAAARLAAGERLYQGRVVNLHSAAASSAAAADDDDDDSTTALWATANGSATVAGFKKSDLLAAAGRRGKGILVPTSAGAGGNNNPNNNNNRQLQSSQTFTQLSMFRYRAALRKQRQGDAEGSRLRHRTHMNINRMDKKHNRLMNGVSVAHAAR